MVLLMVPIIFRSLLGFFQNEEIGCEDTGFTKKKRGRKKKIRTPEISATLWMGTSFLLCSPFPFLMALQFRRQTHTCTSPTGFNDNTLTKAYGSGFKQTRRDGNSSGNQRGYKEGAIVVFEVGCKFIPVYLLSTAIMAQLEAMKEAFIPSSSLIIYRLEMKFGNGGWEIIMEEILLEWRGKGGKQKHKGCLFTAGWGLVMMTGYGDGCLWEPWVPN